MHLSILTICVIFRFLNCNMHARFALLSAGLGGFLSTICAFIIHALQNAAQILFVTDGSFDYFLDTIGIIFRKYCLSEVLLFLVPCIKMLFLLLIIIFNFLCCRIKIISAYIVHIQNIIE